MVSTLTAAGILALEAAWLQVELLLDSGMRLNRPIAAFPGSPESPMTEQELEKKARECLGRGTHPLSPAATDTLLERIAHVENLKDTSLLLRGLF